MGSVAPLKGETWAGRGLFQGGGGGGGSSGSLIVNMSRFLWKSVIKRISYLLEIFKHKFSFFK